MASAANKDAVALLGEHFKAAKKAAAQAAKDAKKTKGDGEPPVTFMVSFKVAGSGSADKFTWVFRVKGPKYYSVNPKAGDKGQRLSPYRNGTFTVECAFPSSYPAGKPEIKFTTVFDHCNINKEGKVCADFWNTIWQGENRNPLTVVQAIHALLANPATDDPLRTEVAEAMGKDLDAWEAGVMEALDDSDDDDDDDDDDDSE